MRNVKNDPFFNVPKTQVTTSEGNVDLPVLYYDVSYVCAYFLCDREPVEEILTGTRLNPVLVSRGRTIAGIACFEYRDTSIGAYNEVGLAVPVVPDGVKVPSIPMADLLKQPKQRTVGFKVIDLPVTTAAANSAGREIWGYPKFVSDIGFTLDSKKFQCTVAEKGETETIMDLSGRFGGGVPCPPMSLMNYDHVNGQDLKTIVNVRGWGTIHSAGSLTLKVLQSGHHMAQHLRDMGIDGAKPTAVFATTKFQSQLHEGIKI